MHMTVTLWNIYWNSYITLNHNITVWTCPPLFFYIFQSKAEDIIDISHLPSSPVTLRYENLKIKLLFYSVTSRTPHSLSLCFKCYSVYFNFSFLKFFLLQVSTLQLLVNCTYCTGIMNSVISAANKGSFWLILLGFLVLKVGSVVLEKLTSKEFSKVFILKNMTIFSLKERRANLGFFFFFFDFWWFIQSWALFTSV